jgi:hypothetical protein
VLFRDIDIPSPGGSDRPALQTVDPFSQIEDLYQEIESALSFFRATDFRPVAPINSSRNRR